MTVGQLKNRDGMVVETMTVVGVPTGNVYKLSSASAQDGRIIAWKQYRQGKVALHPTVRCRVLDYRAYHGTYGPF